MGPDAASVLCGVGNARCLSPPHDLLETARAILKRSFPERICVQYER
jgi:hypothetical protein